MRWSGRPSPRLGPHGVGPRRYLCLCKADLPPARPRSDWTRNADARGKAVGGLDGGLKVADV